MERIVVAISPPSIFTLGSLRFACFAGQVLRLPTSGFLMAYLRLCSGVCSGVCSGSDVGIERSCVAGGCNPPYTSVTINLLLNRFTKSK